MPYNNIPGAKFYKTDGNTRDEAGSAAPSVCIIGVSGKGQAYQGFPVRTTALAKSEFGSEGNLLRGMWEAKKAGANEILLYRIGCTPATLTGIGDTAGVSGYTITTTEQKPTAGDEYSIWYDDTTNRLVVYRVSDSVIVYDNSPGNEIDLYEVTVSDGRATGGGADIGSPSSPVVISSVTTTGTTYTAGTDGLSLSKMELYEKLYVAYKGLLQETFDVVVPMGVFLDDYNIIDQGHYLERQLSGITPVIPVGQTYPTAGAYTLGTDVDSLGTVYVEEYLGEYYFWWRISTGSFTAADIYPSVGSADATHTIDGTLLTADDFHEVNFGYQLGRFLYDYSTDIVDATGVIGVLPPAANDVASRARWVGKAPTWTQNTTTGEYYIASASDNGYGLLGNKFMVGQSDHRSGVFGGGFILTDTEFMDGEEQVDSNEVEVDLGKYLSVFADTLLLRNNWLSSGYLGTGAAGYGGFYLELNPSSAPTNKKVPIGMDRVFKIGIPDINNLVGAGYVTTRIKPQGLVFVDAPTATLPNSDWRRLSTVRIVKDIIDGVRSVADPYIGEGFSQAAKNSLKTEIDKVLEIAKKAGYLKDYKEYEIIQTPSMAVNGTAEITLRLVPAFELRIITVTVAVQKS
jgi:hypothetical protein